MARFFHFLQCIGKAVVKNGGRVLANLVPFGEVLFELARDAQEEYRKDRIEADLRADLESLVRASPAEVRQAAEKVAEQEAGDQPAEVQLALVSYLDQLPGSIRQSQWQATEPDNSKASSATDLVELVELLDSVPRDKGPTVRVKSPKRTYDLHTLLAAGDVADVHLASAPRESAYVLKVSRIPGAQALLDNERQNLTDLLTAAGDTTYRKYLPTLVESFPAKDAFAKRLNVFLYEPGLWTLEQVHARHPALDGRHLAWIYLRLLTILGFSHSQGIVHGAILPCHVMVHAGNHGLQLVGWGQSVEKGGQIASISTRYKDWYPPEVLKKQPASPATDLFLAARCLIYLAGGDPVRDWMPDVVPVPMQRFLRSSLLEGVKMRPQNAWTLMDEFAELLRQLYGPPKFVELAMN